MKMPLIFPCYVQIFFYLSFFSPLILRAQNRNNIWCFGDSAGIDFNNISSLVPIGTSMDGRGSCVSIADTNGQLLFYAFTIAGIPGNTSRVFTKNHSLMTNGDNIVGEAWYQELVILPDPADESLYYLFSCHETNNPNPGLYYSKIDMT